MPRNTDCLWYLLHETPEDYLKELDAIAAEDVRFLKEVGIQYDDSWVRRGGVGAFMMLARKWDRLENRLKDPPLCDSREQFYDRWDVIAGALRDDRREGLIDDIRDLRRYLALVEAYCVFVEKQTNFKSNNNNPDIRSILGEIST